MPKRFLVALLAVVLAGVLIPAAASAQPPSYLTQWGAFGSGDGQFIVPMDVAVDGSGNVYVADNSNHRIQVFTSSGTYVTKWGTPGTGNGQFKQPRGVALDGSGNVYVAENENHRIQKFTSDGTYVTQWGSYGAGDGQFSWPASVAVDASDNVYVTDNQNYRIQKFTSDGTYITQWGSYGTGNGQFRGLWGVAVDASGNVYVADNANARIQKFTSSGIYVTQWGSLGTGDGQFDYPCGVAVDGSGNVYVADASNHRIQVFTGDGTYVTQWGSHGHTEGLFDYPYGVAVDGGKAYVADGSNNRIQVFDATTPVLVSLASADVTADGVKLAWYMGGSESGVATVYRSPVGGEWTRVAEVTADGTGYLRHTDPIDPTASRAGYRLGIIEAGVEGFYGETWVDLPARNAAFALASVRPNPSHGERLSVAFTLPTAATARLELLDVSGRRVVEREVGSLGAGQHALDLGQGQHLAPGLYLVRLTQGANTRTTRVAVIN